MSKFRIFKKFSLDFLGEEWKESYINFQALTVTDVKVKFPQLSKMGEKEGEDVVKGIDAVIEILKSKFVDGKGVGEKGQVVDLEATDLVDLPVEVLSNALSFLSQGAGKKPLAP